MADLGQTGTARCNEQCGCPFPCPGGDACRCATVGTAAGMMEHKKCSCGEHCGCNPCTCGKNAPSATGGRAECTCGPGCTCVSCAT